MSSTAIKSGGVISPRRTADGRYGVRWWGLVLSDVAVCALAIALSSRFHFDLHAKTVRPVLLSEFTTIPITVALLAWWGSYQRTVVWVRKIPVLLAATAVSFAIGEKLAGWAANGSKIGTPFFSTWLLTFVALLLLRLSWRFSAGKRAQSSDIRVVILGGAESVNGLYGALTRQGPSPLNGGRSLKISAIFADGVREWPETASQDLVVSDTEWTKSFVECCDIQCGIIAVPTECDKGTAELIEKSAGIFEDLFIAPQIDRDGVTATAVMRRGSNLEIRVGNCTARSEANILKRIVDLTGALVLGILALPFVLLVAIAIRLTSKGPIFYKQLRAGKGNRVFAILKFRTMFVDSSERLNHYLETDPALRAEWESVHKLKDDPRVTSVGRFLRRFSLDELPQIWNILEGEMSLVGPRPLPLYEIQRYRFDYAAYEAVRPGLTGLWQISGRSDTTYQQRVDYDSYYVRNWSLWLDARIIAKTFRAVISGAGAY